jgi:hypothetical protein
MPIPVVDEAPMYDISRALYLAADSVKATAVLL